MERDEEWEKRDLDLYSNDKKEWLAEMGIEIQDFDQKITVHQGIGNRVVVDIFANDNPDVVAMKVRHAIDGKDFIEVDHSRSGQKLLIKEGESK